ncbi:MAG TPA: DNA metabolism protein [Clostridiales bacterium]|nr:DNA metabolism protein [Clostridiales bacterium]
MAVRETGWSPVCYEYDGSFAGFLTCVFESYAAKEEPVAFFAPEDTRYALWPTRRIDTHPQRAGRVYRALEPKLGVWGKRLVCRGFLAGMEERERHIWAFLAYGLRRGPEAARDLGDPRVDCLRRAVEQLEEEAHRYTGFVRFSDYGGMLVGEIAPKNRVLPLLRPHFVQRFAGEDFFLHDRTHREGLVYQQGRWSIVPVEGLTLPPLDEEEEGYRQLWRRFFHAVSIAQRENPKAQARNLPHRYRSEMVEFESEG